MKTEVKANIPEEEEKERERDLRNDQRRNGNDQALTQVWSEANLIGDVLVARQKELDNIESAMRQVSDIVNDLGIEVKEQDTKLDLIVAQTRSTKENTKEALRQNQISENRQASAMRCACCIRCLIGLIALAIIVVVSYSMYKHFKK